MNWGPTRRSVQAADFQKKIDPPISCLSQQFETLNPSPLTTRLRQSQNVLNSSYRRLMLLLFKVGGWVGEGWWGDFCKTRYVAHVSFYCCSYVLVYSACALIITEMRSLAPGDGIVRILFSDTFTPCCSLPSIAERHLSLLIACFVSYAHTLKNVYIWSSSIKSDICC